MSFTPVTRTSHSIPKTLQEFAKERKLPLEKLDFELLHFETLVRRKDEADFQVIDNPKTLTKEDFLNQEIQIIQEYTIKIIPSPLQATSQKIYITLGVNKLKTKAMITFKKGSIFTKHPKLLQELRDMIWKKKLQAALFINIFEPQFVPQLKKVAQVLPYGKPLPKDITFTVAFGVQPTPPKNAQLEKLFENKTDNQSIINGVDEGDLIARYIKEQRGKDGRSCNGKYITVPLPKVKNIRPQTDESISVKENNALIEYFAKTTGYVVYKENKLFISQTLKLAGANFKSSAKIDSGDSQRDVSVHIEHKKSHSEDAIGSGVAIDVKELNVEGSVGANVSIHTHQLNIDAQTHKNSKIAVGDQANVKLHRGDMIANDAHIEMLETGKVSAHKSIHIKKMLGGEAVAPVVKVDELLSNSTIIASERIEIGSLQGENNHLIIDPHAIESYHKELELLKKKIKEQEKELRKSKDLFATKQQEYIQKMQRIKTFQERIKKATQDGKKPMKQDVIRVKMFKKETVAMQEEQVQLHTQETELQTLQTELEKMLEKELHSTIICHSSYDGHTKIAFVDTQTHKKIEARPEGKQEKICLQVNNQGEKEIHYG